MALMNINWFNNHSQTISVQSGRSYSMREAAVFNHNFVRVLLDSWMCTYNVQRTTYNGIYALYLELVKLNGYILMS